MIKCLYIAGQLWIFQGDSAINLNQAANAELSGSTLMIQQVHRYHTKITVDSPLYEALESCEG